MRRSGRSFLLLGAFALLALTTLPGCENPFDPIDKNTNIQGLSFVDFTLSWDRWDSDPEFDGVVLQMTYSNEFGDSLSFHDKPHNIQVEFWTEKDATPPEEGKTVPQTFDKLIYTRTIRFSNSDDNVRIPIEDYRAKLQGAGLDLSADVKVFVIVRVFPPLEFPRRELVVGFPDLVVFKPEITDVTPNP